MLSIPSLLAVIDAYRAATDVEDKTVSNRVFADSKKISALRDGADITVGRFNDAMVWFSHNWPSHAAWPLSVVRPDEHVTPREAAE